MISISVIIVGHNGENYLRNCLNSIMDQSLPQSEYEVIYVDNDSTDKSINLVREHFPSVILMARDSNRGYYGGFNDAAIDIATGEYLLALPQDTILHHRCLEELQHAAIETPEMMVGLVNTINPPAAEYSEKDRYNMPDHVYWCSTNRFGQTNLIQRDFFETPKTILAYSGVSALIRRDAQKYLFGYFDERLSHLVGDVELGVRANVLGYQCLIVSRAVVFHVEDNKTFHNTSFLQRSLLGARDSIIIYFKLMYTLEFMLFSPLLMLGQATKVFTLRFSLWQRIILFFPALLLSPVTFVLALLRIPEFVDSRQQILSCRRNGKFRLLWTVITKSLD